MRASRHIQSSKSASKDTQQQQRNKSSQGCISEYFPSFRVLTDFKATVEAIDTQLCLGLIKWRHAFDNSITKDVGGNKFVLEEERGRLNPQLR